MKICSLLLLLLISFGCSSKKKTVTISPDEYLRLNKLHAPKHKICTEQRDQVLTKAITEAEQAELDDETYFFVRDEAKALSFITKFDLSKFTLKENQQENEAIIMGCVAPVSPGYKSCDTLAPAFKYFRGLIYGMRQYQWSQKTKDLIIAQTLSYLDYVGRSESSLMDIFYANDLLMRLSDLGFIPSTLYQETVGFRKEGEKVHQELIKIIKKLGKKELTCADAQEFYQGEREKVKQLSQDFLAMLRNAQ